MQIDFWQENMRERSDLEDLGVNGRIMLNGCQRKKSEKVCPGFLWVKMQTCEGLLWKP
jgi:hypothetical protein